MPLITDLRPQSLDEFQGNKDTVAILRSILEKDSSNRPHTYLFTGPRGCGKTTLAKILAKELECDELDFIEMNTASFRGIDTARNIIKNLSLRPVKGNVRVYFLDECHQLTKDAQDALLKAVEQPPKHVYFIFSTTDPQQLKPTLVDRCLQLKVAPLDEKQCIRYIKKVLISLGKKIPNDIIENIYEVSDGRPRACLMNIEKVITTENPEEMKKLLTKHDEFKTEVIHLCRNLINKTSWKQTANILKGLKNEEPEQIRRAVIGYFSSVLLNSDNARAFQILLNFSEPYYNNGFSGLIASCYACYVE